LGANNVGNFARQAGGVTEFGWVAGAGLEYKLRENLLLRAEYLHYDFGSINNFWGFWPAVDNAYMRTAVDAVRGGLSYKFGPEGAADSGLKDTASGSDWSGLYAGIDGGGGWGQTDFSQGFQILPVSFALGQVFQAPNQSSSGGLAGGHLGYNWQYGRAVAGLEVDFDAADIKSRANLPAPLSQTILSSAISQEVKVDELASVRARLGWEVRPDLLAYGTGGIGMGHFQSTISNSAVLLFDPAAGAFSRSVMAAGGATEFGWVAGAGFEYKLLDRWLLRAEYLHYGFGSLSNALSAIYTEPYTDNLNARTTVDVVRGGLSYKF
jgi:outer membrane immunogenic protein